MPRLEKSLPRLGIHKPSGQFCVDLSGRCIYLGKTKRIAKQNYDIAVAEWLSNGRQHPVAKSQQVTVNKVILDYVKFAKTYYVKRGKLTSEYL